MIITSPASNDKGGIVTVEQETVNRAEAMDVLNSLRREVVKATCLSWDVSTDFFEPLALAVGNEDFIRVKMLAEVDAEQAGAKAEIISDILMRMAKMIDDAKAKYSASQGACNSIERGECNVNSDMEAGG